VSSSVEKTAEAVKKMERTRKKCCSEQVKVFEEGAPHPFLRSQNRVSKKRNFMFNHKGSSKASPGKAQEWVRD
jgi:hypothetical protein